MRKIWPVFLALFLLCLTGCQTATPEEPVPTKTAEVPTAAPTQVEEVVEENYCLSCHTDKEQLIDTAKPEEVVEEESKGVG